MEIARSTAATLFTESPVRARSFSRGTALLLALVGSLSVALFARIMSYPLQHDEQFYLPAAILFSFDGLYADLGFSHLPNLPLLLAGIFRLSGTDHYLLVGRLLIVVAWLATIGLLVTAGYRYAADRIVTALMVVLLAANPALLGAAGMAVTNNFVAAPFILGGLILFIDVAKRELPSAGHMAIAGFLLAMGVGFKANYAVALLPIAIAALLVPLHLSLGMRVQRVVLPLLIGGVIGAAPTLYMMAGDPTGFVAHTFSFHRGPQITYWQSLINPADPKIMSLAGKAMLAQREWLSGANFVLLFGLAFYAALMFSTANNRQSWRKVADWPILLVASVTAVIAAASFLPTPAFPQYYASHLPFAILLLALLHGKLEANLRAMAHPFLIAALGVTLLAGAPMLLSSLPNLAKGSAWTGIRVHHDAQRIAAIARHSPVRAPVATLSPIYALEANLPVYPHLAMGPFVYRASEWIPADDRRHYHNLASPQDVGRLLSTVPPSAILVGLEGVLDDPLATYAIAHRYTEYPIPLGRDNEQKSLRLFIAAGASPNESPSTPRPDPAAKSDAAHPTTTPYSAALR